MLLMMRKKVAEAIGFKNLKRYGLEEDKWSWRDAGSIDISRLKPKDLDALETLIAGVKSTYGASVLLRDIATWRHAQTVGASSAKSRNARQFCDLLKKTMLDVPSKWVFERREGDVWLAHYVESVEWHHSTNHRGEKCPPYTVVRFVHDDFGGKKQSTETFYDEDCGGMTVAQALADKNLYLPSDEMMRRYESELAAFTEVVKHVGRQYLAVGTGTDDLDGNTSRSSSWYWSRTNVVQLLRSGAPTRVVVDVFYEDEKTDREERTVHVNPWFWSNASSLRGVGDDDSCDDDEVELGDGDRPEVQIPVHPFVAVFDLSKHLRVRTHVTNLTEYRYDPTIVDKLVLTPELKSLVKMLLGHKTVGFRDIVGGKAGGAVVLLTGPPGVGKTLTAEVYAESEGRALYSVQCSQLGTDPAALEDELLKVFARARRWNAVLLLDEADVYVHERGRDLNQNAIVGVFLRVLEYQDNVLFLTTNRPDDVDDAIASRCVARLSYRVPSADDQARIWRVLADACGATLDDEELRLIVASSPDLSGRDIKNILKLALLVGGRRPVTAKVVEFVKRFQPTRSHDVEDGITLEDVLAITIPRRRGLIPKARRPENGGA